MSVPSRKKTGGHFQVHISRLSLRSLRSLAANFGFRAYPGRQKRWPLRTSALVGAVREELVTALFENLGLARAVGVEIQEHAFLQVGTL